MRKFPSSPILSTLANRAFEGLNGTVFSPSIHVLWIKLDVSKRLELSPFPLYVASRGVFLLLSSRCERVNT